MNLKLNRTQCSLYGIFGVLYDENMNSIAVTLEHAYVVGNAFVPKLAAGTYTCKRGMHELKNGIQFQTFEIMNVPDFQGNPVTGILFHVGNYNADSEGCILMGTTKLAGCIVDSGVAFTRFINMQKDVDEFTLTVS
jgi:hypothetical protein